MEVGRQLSCRKNGFHEEFFPDIFFDTLRIVLKHMSSRLLVNLYVIILTIRTLEKAVAKKWNVIKTKKKQLRKMKCALQVNG